MHDICLSQVGVVTSLLFKLHAVQTPGVYAGTLVFPVEWGKEVIKIRQVFSTWLQVRTPLVLHPARVAPYPRHESGRLLSLCSTTAHIACLAI